MAFAFNRANSKAAAAKSPPSKKNNRSVVAVGVSQRQFLQQRIRDAEATRERLLKEKEEALRRKLAILEDDIVTLQRKSLHHSLGP